MAWWRKRQATRSSEFDGAARRKPQSAPIPAPREEIGASDDRWEAIKRDLIAVDPDFFGELASQSKGLGSELESQSERTGRNDTPGGERARQIVENGADRLTGVAAPRSSGEITDERLIQSLRRMSIRYLVDEAGALLAMWERHVLQIRREGPSGEILVLRARTYATLPTEWSDRAFRAVNEWNRSRRFLKAYVGEATESGNLPLYGETQVPLRPGVSDALLDEFIDCAAAVSGAYVDWLHNEAGVL